MKYFRINWDPGKTPESDPALHPEKADWSWGNSNKVQPGDRFFLLRLVKAPKGIVASGVILSTPFVKAGSPNQLQKGRHIGVRFDRILPSSDPHNYKGMNWTVQNPSVQIPNGIAEKVEKAWSKFFILAVQPSLPDEMDASLAIYEGAVKPVLITAYERRPEARRLCLAHYGPLCVVCGFDFEAKYGSAGLNKIHVHHLVPLSKIRRDYQVNPIQDMRPVCPNCHAVIHDRDPPFSIEEMKARFQR